MNITLTNLGTVAVPFFSSQGEGFAVELTPGQPYVLDQQGVTVASVGDNPSFVDELKQAAQAIYELLMKLIAFWRTHQPIEYLGTETCVHVLIQNHGANGLRLILGDNTDDTELASGCSFTALVPGYVEIRELGV